MTVFFLFYFLPILLLVYYILSARPLQWQSVFASGVSRFSMGLAKKFLLAGPAGILWENLLMLPEEQFTILGAWIAAIALFLHLYFFFSGCVDLIVGLGQMLGFSLPDRLHRFYPLLIFIGILLPSDNWEKLAACLKTMAGFGQDVFWNPVTGFYLKSNLLLLLSGALFTTPLVPRLYERLPHGMRQTIKSGIAVTFCGFIGIFSLLGILLPDQSFSEAENRYLQQFPVMTQSSLTSGRFLTELEEYVTDQFPFRDNWLRLHSLSLRVLGSPQRGDIYFASQNTLIRRIPEPDPDALVKKTAVLNGFADDLDVPLFLAVIPSAASLWQDRLPHGAPTADEAQCIRFLYEQIQFPGIDISSALAEHAEEEIYYRTDHHWTSLGAFWGANAIFHAMELPPLSLTDYTPRTVSRSFCGTAYTSSLAWWIPPDSIQMYVPADDVEVISNFTGKEEPGSLYREDKLLTKQPYTYFLGGNQPLCVIRSDADGPRVLIIRDSYADCLAPFLSERFSEIHLVDLRYNRSNLREYIRQHQIQSVLVLYSFSQFTEADHFFLLEEK